MEKNTTIGIIPKSSKANCIPLTHKYITNILDCRSTSSCGAKLFYGPRPNFFFNELPMCVLNHSVHKFPRHILGKRICLWKQNIAFFSKIYKAGKIHCCSSSLIYCVCFVFIIYVFHGSRERPFRVFVF